MPLCLITCSVHWPCVRSNLSQLYKVKHSGHTPQLLFLSCPSPVLGGHRALEGPYSMHNIISLGKASSPRPNDCAWKVISSLSSVTSLTFHVSYSPFMSQPLSDGDNNANENAVSAHHVPSTVLRASQILLPVTPTITSRSRSSYDSLSMAGNKEVECQVTNSNQHWTQGLLTTQPTLHHNSVLYSFRWYWRYSWKFHPAVT